jgi:transposase-like protein
MTKISYSGYRFPPEIIHQAIWLYLRFTLSFRDVEDLLVERGIAISYETIRRWVNHFGPIIAAELRKRRPKPHSIWHLDEVYLKIGWNAWVQVCDLGPMKRLAKTIMAKAEGILRSIATGLSNGAKYSHV